MISPKKVVILGHFGVGKTSLIRQFVDEQFSEDYLVTVGVHVKKKEVSVNKKLITLVIWDVEGNTAIEKVRKSYLLGAHGFIYVFDISRPETYQDIESELKYMQEHHSNIPLQIIGNKSDMFNDTINKDYFSAEKFNNCLFTSAKTGENVEIAFQELSKNMLAK